MGKGAAVRGSHRGSNSNRSRSKRQGRSWNGERGGCQRELGWHRCKLKRCRSSCKLNRCGGCCKWKRGLCKGKWSWGSKLKRCWWSSKLKRSRSRRKGKRSNWCRCSKGGDRCRSSHRNRGCDSVEQWGGGRNGLKELEQVQQELGQEQQGWSSQAQLLQLLAYHTVLTVCHIPLLSASFSQMWQ